MPVASYKNAVFLMNEVSGIDIPQKVIDSLKNAETDEVRKISISYSKNIIDKVYNSVDGFYLVIPLKKVGFVCDLADYIKEKEKNYDNNR